MEKKKYIIPESCVAGMLSGRDYLQVASNGEDLRIDDGYGEIPGSDFWG